MPMPEKKHKKVSFTEEDAATLTQRYNATTVLTLLQEVAHYPHSKIDWNELVKKTSTGISNAREYQMLWRHLAYRDALPEYLGDGVEPLDDDSDLECELEALPPMSAESVAEAAACVKVMIASCTLSESSPSSSTIEAPLTINVPGFHSSRTPNESSQPSNLMQGTSIIFPVTVQRQTLPNVSSTEGTETKGLVRGNTASKRKRKAWSEEEDMQLRAAVQRWGEGNWATMAKGDNFPIKRSPTQLAQRWAILRKKGGSNNSGPILASTQYTTAEHLATRHSLSLALDMPFKKLTSPGSTEPARTSFNVSIKSSGQPCNTTEATIRNNFVPAQNPSQEALLGSCGYPAESNLIPEKPVTAGSSARMVSPSDTASHLKVAQVRNAGDIGPSSLTKSTISTTGLRSSQKVHSDLPNVGIDSSAASIPTHSTVVVTSSCSNTIKAASPTLKNSPSSLSTSEQDKHVTSVVSEVPQTQELNTKEEFRVSDASPAPIEIVHKDETPTFKEDERINLPDNKGSKTPIVKNTSEEISNNKVVVSQNSEECEDQGNHQIATDSNQDKGS